MMDLDRVQELYDLQSSPTATPDEQQKAKDKIAQIADTVVEEYLSTLLCAEGIRKGRRRLESLEVLWARNVIEGPIVGKDSKAETSPPIEDKVGNILFHRRYSQSQ